MKERYETMIRYYHAEFGTAFSFPLSKNGLALLESWRYYLESLFKIVSQLVLRFRLATLILHTKLF